MVGKILGTVLIVVIVHLAMRFFLVDARRPAEDPPGDGHVLRHGPPLCILALTCLGMALVVLIWGMGEPPRRSSDSYALIGLVAGFGLFGAVIGNEARARLLLTDSDIVFSSPWRRLPPEKLERARELYSGSWGAG